MIVEGIIVALLMAAAGASGYRVGRDRGYAAAEAAEDRECREAAFEAAKRPRGQMPLVTVWPGTSLCVMEGPTYPAWFRAQPEGSLLYLGSLIPREFVLRQIPRKEADKIRMDTEMSRRDQT